MPRLKPPNLFPQVDRMMRSVLRRRFIIVAGPYMGKSSVLGRLRTNVETTWRVDLATCADWADVPAPPKTLLDLVVDNAHAQEELLPRLVTEASRRGDDPKIVIATERTPSNLAQLGSGADEQFTILELNPWKQTVSEARTTHEVAWEEAWKQTQRELYDALGLDRPLEPLPSAWVDRMFDLTSGHPALVEAAYELTVLTYESHLWTETTPLFHEQVCARLVDDAAFLETQLMRKAESVADEVLAWIERQPIDVIDVLRRSDAHPRDLSMEQEWCLRVAGLIMGPSDFMAWTAPKILRPLILRRIAKGGLSTAPLLMRPDAEGDGGTIELYPGTPNSKALHVRGRGWTVFRMLYEANGEVVSIDRILESLPDAGSDQVVRSAVQRILDRLKSQKLPRLIENQHGRGYAYRPPPPPS